MTIFYTGPCGRITHKAVVLDRPHRSFAIRDIHCPFVVYQVQRSPVITVRVKVCSGLSGVGAVLTLTSWPLLHPALVPALTLLVMASTLAGVAHHWYRQTCADQLWVFYRGHPVLLFESADRRVFGQFTRALRRALEARDR